MLSSAEQMVSRKLQPHAVTGYSAPGRESSGIAANFLVAFNFAEI